MMMSNYKNRLRRISRAKKTAALQLMPAIETFEERVVLSGTGFLQGTVFIDNNNDGKFNVGDTKQVGLEVDLYSTDSTGGNAVFQGSTNTDSDGNYLFANLDPGYYKLVELPQAGYRNAGTETNSPLTPVQSGGTAGTIYAQVLDPSQFVVNYSYAEEDARSPGAVTFSYSIDPTVTSGSIGQLPIFVTGPNGFATDKFASYCVDLSHSMKVALQSFNANAQAISTTLAAPNANRIGYLYEQYGNVLADVTTKPIDPTELNSILNRQALQLAIWELEYDTTPDFSSGVFKDLALYTGPMNAGFVQDPAGIGDLETRAMAYITEAMNYSEQAVVLKAVAKTSIPQGSGFQDVLAPGTLNFYNAPKASPSIATTASGGGVVGVAIPQDTATVSGGSQPGGTVTFTLTGPDNTTVVDTEIVALVNGMASTSSTYVPTQVGTYTWHATYSGDTNNNMAVDDGANESVTITTASPSITTDASDGGVVGVVGSTTDTATLSGAYSPTGTVTFTLKDGSGNVVYTGDKDVSAITPNGDGSLTIVSASVPLTAAGTYHWSATYNGDGNNSPVTDDSGAAEDVTITPASPSITTTASRKSGDGKVGTIIQDTATLSGAYQPGGTITFTVTLPDGSTVQVGDPVLVTANTTYTSAPYTTTQVGTYLFHATYSGDTNNSGDVDDGANESIVISGSTTNTKCNPTITTCATVSCGNVVGAAKMSDTATIKGGTSPSGYIVFTLTGPDGKTITVGTVTVTKNGTYSSPSVTATLVGTYTWHAHYSGDTKNNSADDNGANESLTIVKDSPTICTTPGITTSQCDTSHNNGCGYDNNFCGPHSNYNNGCGWDDNDCGYGYNNNGYGSYSNKSSNIILTDTAVLSGGYHETGTITFTLTMGGKVLDTETVKVNGDGTYKTPKGYQLPSNASPGIYQWNAVYSGDSKNNGFSDVNNQNEQIVISNPGGSNCGNGGGSNCNYGSSKDCNETGSSSFWCGSQGQALIKCFNGGSSKTSLGNWLASTCPNLFGSLKGCSNSQVASCLQSYAKSSSKQANMEALCLALNTYATNCNLSGNCGQSYYGVNVSSFGLGSTTCFLDSYGKEVGLSDNGSCTVLSLLQKIDGQCRNGNINSSAYNAVNSLCGSINRI